MDFAVASESLDGGIYVVSVTGEIDLATGPALERVLLGLPEKGVASVIVDLTNCSFMDSTGLHLLVRAQRRFGRSGGRFAALNGDGAGRRRGTTAPEGTTRGRKAGRAADLTSVNSNDGGPIYDRGDPRLGEPSL